MANDRVMIRCEGCGAWKMLLKHFPSALGTRDNGILEWIESHCPCHPRFDLSDLGGNPGFSLLTENANDLDMAKQNAPPPKSSLDTEKKGA